jgi:serine protease Do
MSQTPANKFIAAIVIVTAPFAMGAFFLARAPLAQYAAADPEYDGYVQPRSMEKLVERTQDSTVTSFVGRDELANENNENQDPST